MTAGAIAHGTVRESRLGRALDGTQVAGCVTNFAFLSTLVRHEAGLVLHRPAALDVVAEVDVRQTCARRADDMVEDDVGAEARPGRVPSHLQSASYAGEKKLGIGVGYVYPHDHPGHWVAQRYLPEGLRGGYYRPSDQGQEARLAEAWRRRRGQPPEEDGQ